jgi:hypothetical protein
MKDVRVSAWPLVLAHGRGLALAFAQRPRWIALACELAFGGADVAGGIHSVDMAIGDC